MEKNMTTTGEALAASQEATLVIEQFLNENYRFRGFKHKEHSHVAYYEVVPL